MKVYKYIIASAAVLAMASCQSDIETTSGEGRVIFDTNINSDIKSRSTQAELEAELGDSFIMWLYRTSGAEAQQGVIRTYQGLDNLPSDLTLKAGSYLAKAWAGDSVSASFDKRWFKGATPFDVTAGNTTPVAIECRIANTVVSVEFTDDALAAYDIDSIYVSHSRGALAFKPDTPRRGYFMMPSKDKNLVWQFVGTRKSDGATKTFSGTFENVKAAYEYKLKVVFVPNTPTNPDDVGGAMVDLYVDTTETPVYDSVQIYAAPLIQGVDFDINEPVVKNNEDFECDVYVTGSSALTSVTVSCPEFASLITTSSGAITSFDAIAIKAGGLIGAINNSGVSWRTYSDGANLKIIFKAPFTVNMDWDKEYRIVIEAKDSNNLTASQTLVMQKTMAPISTPTAPAEGDSKLTPTSYKVEGAILKDLEPGTEIYGYYAESANQSRAEWTQVPATISGSKYTIEFTGLKADHYYEYYITVGSYTSSIVEFKTVDGQLPNCGFEDWQTSSSPYLIYPAGGQMFWDSGNHGSATMKKNVTVPDNSIKHSGNYSICLQSQFVGLGAIGKFAAGNVFIGQYLATEGTDGVLGFGRPFTYSPTAVKGWVKYSPVNISHVASDAPLEYVKGEGDKGIIYVALLDGTTPDSQYPDFPVIIKTKSKQLFDKNGSNVIAYGELVFSEATAGSGMVEFEINLTYKRPGVTPSFIMLTASASKGGDYFSGGDGSKMWLDDIELVY